MAKTKNKVIRRVFRKAKRTFHKPKFTLPLAVVGGFLPMGGRLVSDWNKYHDINIITRELGQFTTGYDWTTGSFSAGGLKYGLLPIVTGMLVHKFVGGNLGVNRMLSRAGIPVIRL